jgi:small subunit ribosomal protein S5
MTNEMKTEQTAAPVVAPTFGARPDARGGQGHRSRVGRGGAGDGGRRNARRGSGGGARAERAKPEFESKTLVVRRVARVVAGGRRFNFSVVLALGNRKGSVGVGIGKAADTAAAIEKATKDARKHLFLIPLTKTRSIPHFVEAKYSSARIVMRPSPRKGLIAGSAARAVLELGGVTDVNAKILSGSKNKLNIARATIQALSSLKAPKGKSETLNPKSETNPNVPSQKS